MLNRLYSNLFLLKNDFSFFISFGWFFFLGIIVWASNCGLCRTIMPGLLNIRVSIVILMCLLLCVTLSFPLAKFHMLCSVHLVCIWSLCSVEDFFPNSLFFILLLWQDYQSSGCGYFLLWIFLSLIWVSSLSCILIICRFGLFIVSHIFWMLCAWTSADLIFSLPEVPISCSFPSVPMVLSHVLYFIGEPYHWDFCLNS